MKDYFLELSDKLCASLPEHEYLSLAFSAEDSDFCRLNNNQIRQAGHVHQAELQLDLADGQKHVSAHWELSGHIEEDVQDLTRLLNELREQRQHVADDPHLLIPESVNNSDEANTGEAPPLGDMVDSLRKHADGLDAVGITANGDMYRGFANSMGQQNWYQTRCFNLDWSAYHTADKASKTNYAGFDWNENELQKRIQQQREELAILTKPATSIAPGYYRVYLAPAALEELVSMMTWGGFGLKSHQTAQTPLIRMVRDNACMSDQITLLEDTQGGVAPGFTQAGFIKQEQVSLIRNGRYEDCLVGPRSAREFDATMTGSEHPESLYLAPGELPESQALAALETGLYINNLWYCNYSEREACRITGMTRFACFWVENGKLSTPINVMRFDDSLYNLLGEYLQDLTSASHILLDTQTYGERSTGSMRLPGALISRMRFTL